MLIPKGEGEGEREGEGEILVWYYSQGSGGGGLFREGHLLECWCLFEAIWYGHLDAWYQPTAFCTDKKITFWPQVPGNLFNSYKLIAIIIFKLSPEVMMPWTSRWRNWILRQAIVKCKAVTKKYSSDANIYHSLCRHVRYIAKSHS